MFCENSLKPEKVDVFFYILNRRNHYRIILHHYKKRKNENESMYNVQFLIHEP